jgi:hypothetical protein
MLTEKVVDHVVESLRKAYADKGWSNRDLDSLERLTRRRAEQINALVEQIQGWAQADEVEYDALCTILGHLPSVHLYFENPFMMQMRMPLGELLLTLSDTIHENGELEGFEVVPNDCPDLVDDESDAEEASPAIKDSKDVKDIKDVKDDELRLFRKAFED